MGQFSTEIYIPPGSTLSGNQQRASERSGHDMSVGRDLPQPSPDEMEADVKTLDDFRLDYNKRRKATSSAREALENPRVATLI